MRKRTVSVTMSILSLILGSKKYIETKHEKKIYNLHLHNIFYVNQIFCLIS